MITDTWNALTFSYTNADLGDFVTPDTFTVEALEPVETDELCFAKTALDWYPVALLIANIAQSLSISTFRRDDDDVTTEPGQLRLMQSCEEDALEKKNLHKHTTQTKKKKHSTHFLPHFPALFTINPYISSILLRVP